MNVHGCSVLLTYPIFDFNILFRIDAKLICPSDENFQAVHFLSFFAHNNIHDRSEFSSVF
jgi:hypothetical protein